MQSSTVYTLFTFQRGKTCSNVKMSVVGLLLSFRAQCQIQQFFSHVTEWAVHILGNLVLQ